MALRDELARRPPKPLLAVDAEEMEVGAGDPVEDSGVTLGCPDLADHGVRRVRRPVDRADVLLHERPRLADHPRATGVERARRLAVKGPLDRLDQRVDSRAAHLVLVDAALSGRAHLESACRPDGAGVEVAVRLEDRHAPLGLAELDRPVERRGAAVAERARVDDQAAARRPDRLRDPPLQHRADDQLRLMGGDGRLHGLRAVDNRDLDAVTELRERNERALAETVVRRDQEQDPAGCASAGHTVMTPRVST